MVQKPKHILLDLDGTLVDFHSLRAQIDFITRAVGSLKGEAGRWRALRGMRAIQTELEKNPSPVV